MNDESFVAAVTAMVEAHPSIWPSGDRHPAHCHLYVTKSGIPMATEPQRKTVANIWVRADSVRRNLLRDCEDAYFDHSTFDQSKPNHNLFREPGFKNTDLIRYQPKNLWEAARIIAEVAGIAA
ncbi:hypothetical protein [Sphingomonas phyllosphaerae]|uniref:hypothetical protein n=1 Tax=Sphingomonas phyllosphaerae TaxID=257003 RepID=UPI0012DCF800|nr:hypothetical protein [Sphingomonas phyllosphaerae]